MFLGGINGSAVVSTNRGRIDAHFQVCKGESHLLSHSLVEMTLQPPSNIDLSVTARSAILPPTFTPAAGATEDLQWEGDDGHKVVGQVEVPEEVGKKSGTSVGKIDAEAKRFAGFEMEAFGGDEARAQAVLENIKWGPDDPPLQPPKKMPSQPTGSVNIEAPEGSVRVSNLTWMESVKRRMHLRKMAGKAGARDFP